MADTPDEQSARELRIAVTSSEPAEIRIDFNALSKAISHYLSRLARSGRLAQMKSDCSGGGPLAVLLVLLDFVRARDSAKILTKSGRMIVWPSNATIQRRSGYGRAAAFAALDKLEAAKLISRLECGGGRDSSVFELLELPEDDSPVYWGGREPRVHPSSRADGYPRAGADGYPSVGVDGSSLPQQTAEVCPDGPQPRAGADPNISGGITNGSDTPQSSRTAAAAGVEDRLRAEGLPGLRIAELSGAPWLTLQYVHDAAREAADKYPANDRKRVGLLLWMLQGEGRTTTRRQTGPKYQDQQQADYKKSAEATATAEQRLAESIARLEAAGLLAGFVTAAIKAEENEFVRAGWSKVEPTAAAVTKKVTLAYAVAKAAKRLPPPSPTVPVQGATAG